MTEEYTAEEVEVTEEEASEEDTPGGGRKEKYKVAGEKLLSKVKELLQEGNIRRINIKNDEDKTLIEIPLTIGVVGAALFPVWAAVTCCHVSIPGYEPQSPDVYSIARAFSCLALGLSEKRGQVPIVRSTRRAAGGYWYLTPFFGNAYAKHENALAVERVMPGRTLLANRAE